MVAEDPAAGWLPSTGTVAVFDIGEGVRVDTGFRAGAVVSADYDSLLAKVIAHAPTRTQAAHTLARALRTSQVSGVRTNIEAMATILLEPDFLAAATPTAYLDEHPDTVAHRPLAGGGVALLLGAVFALEQHDRSADPVLGFAPSGWRNMRTQGQREQWTDLTSGDEHHVEFVLHGRDRATVHLGPVAAADRRRDAVSRRPRQGRRPTPRSHVRTPGGRGRWCAVGGQRADRAVGQRVAVGRRGAQSDGCTNVRAGAGVRRARCRRRRWRADLAAARNGDRRPCRASATRSRKANC